MPHTLQQSPEREDRKEILKIKILFCCLRSNLAQGKQPGETLVIFNILYVFENTLMYCGTC
jgi:hypothetical protein